MTNYSLMSDEELVKMMQSAAHEKEIFNELVIRYKKFINFKTRSYFIAGADKDDVFQEGLIGLYNAVNAYEESRNASFGTFAVLCITRQIQSAVKMASRKKHTPLNGYISLWGDDKETEDLKEKYGLTASDPSQDPEEILMKKELSERVMYVIENLLSEKEKSLYLDFINGNSYREISQKHKQDMKAIDNAIQRARKKIELYTKTF
ncbi:MAG: sigma-70 family RNA polymerase sigma factor [Anaerofustis sp.]